MAERPVLKLKSALTEPVPTPVVTEIPVAPVVTEPPVSQAPPSVSDASQMQPPPKKKPRFEFGDEVHAFLDVLCQNHPDHFPLCGPQVKNWAIGLSDEIVARYGVDLDMCKSALRVWVLRYGFQHMQALSSGGPRYNLAGDVVGEVTPEQQATAQMDVQNMRAKQKGKKSPGLRQIGKKVKTARPDPALALVPSPLPSSKQGEQTMHTIEVRSFKVTIALDAVMLPTDCIAPDGQPAPPIPMVFQCGDLALTATFPGKNYKKAMKGVVPGAFAVIQGKLGSDNTLSECGLTIQPPKVAEGQ